MGNLDGCLTGIVYNALLEFTITNMRVDILYITHKLLFIIINLKLFYKVGFRDFPIIFKNNRKIKKSGIFKFKIMTMSSS